MIKNMLPVLIAERRMKVSEVSDKTGITRKTLYRIYNDQTSRIDFDTLDKLCKLFDVQVNDILEYVPDEKEQKEV